MHADGRWSEGVVVWEEEGAPVLAVMIWCLGRPCKYVVPFENVGFGWVGDDEGRWIGLNRLVFTGELHQMLAQ